ncbi:hypothetical protein LDK88_09915, partial [Staphylococcus haemolyticus]
LGHVKVLLGMFLSLKTLYRKRTVIWPFYFYTIIRTLSDSDLYTVTAKTNKGKTFTYTFSENHTLKEIRYTLEEIAKQLDI